MIRNFAATESQHLRIIKFPQPVQVLEIVDMIKLLHCSLAPRDMLFGCRMTPAGLKTEVIVQERKPLISRKDRESYPRYAVEGFRGLNT